MESDIQGSRKIISHNRILPNLGTVTQNRKKKKKKKEVILTEGVDLPTEEGGKFMLHRWRNWPDCGVTTDTIDGAIIMS